MEGEDILIKGLEKASIEDDDEEESVKSDEVFHSDGSFVNFCPCGWGLVKDDVERSDGLCEDCLASVAEVEKTTDVEEGKTLFLDKYIVYNWYKPKDFKIMADWNEERMYAFKQYMIKAVCANDELHSIISEIADNFVKVVEEEEEEEEEK